MGNRLFRALLALCFLISVQVVYTFWSQTGGQYHLDLMFWPWKVGLGLAAAGLVTALIAQWIRPEGVRTRRVVVLAALLLLVMTAAGVVTYYYHLHEPADEEQDDVEQTSRVT